MRRNVRMTKTCSVHSDGNGFYHWKASEYCHIGCLMLPVVRDSWNTSSEKQQVYDTLSNNSLSLHCIAVAHEWGTINCTLASKPNICRLLHLALDYKVNMRSMRKLCKKEKNQPAKRSF
jgi:hypothetical protein